MNKEKLFLGLRISALIESFIFFAIMIAIDIFLGSSNRFINFDLHPFWIAVILISAQYGPSEGLMVAVISSLVLLVFNLPLQTINQDMYDYLLLVSYMPILWIISSLLIGQLSLRHITRSRDLSLSLEKEKKSNKAITKHYNQMKRIKETIESRFVSGFESNVDIYESIKSIECDDKNKVLLNVREVLRSTLNPEKFSIFAVGKDGLEALLSSGWEEGEKYQRRFFKGTEIYNAIVNEKRNISIVNELDEKILGKEGFVASPLIDIKDGSVFAMVKIEKIGFEGLKVGNIHSFYKLCELVGIAYANARTFNVVTKNLLVDADSGLLSYNMLLEQSELFDIIGCKKLFATIEFEEDISAISSRVVPNIIKYKPKEVLFFADKDSRNRVIFLFPNYTKLNANKVLKGMLEQIIFAKSFEITESIG